MFYYFTTFFLPLFFKNFYWALWTWYFWQFMRVLSLTASWDVLNFDLQRGLLTPEAEVSKEWHGGRMPQWISIRRKIKDNIFMAVLLNELRASADGRCKLSVHKRSYTIKTQLQHSRISVESIGHFPVPFCLFNLRLSIRGQGPGLLNFFFGSRPFPSPVVCPVCSLYVLGHSVKVITVNRSISYQYIKKYIENKRHVTDYAH